ncbi:acetylxylan esterase, partial [Planctomicrobium sp.]
YDAYHPWTPPNSLKEWKVEAEQIRRQLLVSNGLWPLPEKTPLSAVIHGKVDQGDYTIEKVYFSSRPGHYVTGSLYRPKNLKGKAPGILCPHGHWQNGRFYDAGDGAEAQLESGAEQFEAGAHSPLQARMVQLARMGCVVFHYDMIGYADSKPLDHRTGFNDAEAAMRLHNIMGIQTWNSIRCLDFVESLPDVDPSRLAVTGASGGGTQTMILAAIDDRVSAAFPAVMVSTGMQGGCVCENASYMRQGVNNVAFAALFAPKPQAMSGADDWTIEIETKGLPELKQVYSLYDQAQNVHAAAFPQFKHNYNQVSRQVMYNWFNDHLALNLEGPIQQTDFKPLTPQKLSVFDAEHTLPGDALAAKELRKLMVSEDRAEFKTWLQGGEKEYRSIVGGAAKVMLSPDVGNVDLVNHKPVIESSGLKAQSATVSYSNGAVVPVNIYHPEDHSKGTVYLFTGEPIAAAPNQVIQKLVNSGLTVVTAELFLTAAAEEAAAYKVDEKYPGYSYCYNNPLVTERVRDILAVVKAFPVEDGKRSVLVGDGVAGVWTLLASSVLDSTVVDEVVVDLEAFTFERIERFDDPNLLPGVLKYGGLTGLSRLINAKTLKVHGVKAPQQFEKAFEGKSSPSQLKISATSITSEEIAAEILGTK